MPERNVQIFRYALPLRAPLALTRPPLTTREGALLRLDDGGGAVGWGEAAPLPGFSRETLDEAVAALRVARKGIAELELSDDEALSQQLARWELPPSARCAVEGAVWSMQAATDGQTLPERLTPTPHTEVPLNGLLIGPAERVLDAAARLRAAGYRAVKLKVGRRPLAEEIDLVRGVAEVLGREVGLRLDANRAWTFGEAVDFAAGIAGVEIEYVEEPLAEPARLPAFAAETGLPVALDESLTEMPPEALAGHGYACAVILKPPLLGGPLTELRWARQALALGQAPVLSSAVESGIGVGLCLALAAGLGARAVPAGLAPYRHLAADVLAPPLDLAGPAVATAAAFETPRAVDAERLTEL